MDEKEECLKRLEKLLQNSDTGMTQDRYLEMMEQLGREPAPEEMPPGWEDFPSIVTDAVQAFNLLGDRIYPEIGYTGKDFTNLEFLLKHFKVAEHEVDFVYNIILWLDSRTIERSQKKLKAEYDRVRNKK